MQKNEAIAEAAKLRAHKETYANSCWWAAFTGLLLLVFLWFLPFPHVCTLTDLLMFFISMVIAYSHHGKPKTTLNTKQLKLFGIDQATVIVAVEGTSSVNIIKPTTSETSSMNTSSTSLRHRAINTKPQLSSPSPAKSSSSSHVYRMETVAMGLTPHTEPRNFDVANAESYKEASWREISEAVDRRNNVAGSNR